MIPTSQCRHEPDWNTLLALRECVSSMQSRPANYESALYLSAEPPRGGYGSFYDTNPRPPSPPRALRDDPVKFQPDLSMRSRESTSSALSASTNYDEYHNGVAPLPRSPAQPHAHQNGRARVEPPTDLYSTEATSHSDSTYASSGLNSSAAGYRAAERGGGGEEAKPHARSERNGPAETQPASSASRARPSWLIVDTRDPAALSAATRRPQDAPQEQLHPHGASSHPSWDEARHLAVPRDPRRHRQHAPPHTSHAKLLSAERQPREGPAHVRHLSAPAEEDEDQVEVWEALDEPHVESAKPAMEPVRRHNAQSPSNSEPSLRRVSMRRETSRDSVASSSASSTRTSTTGTTNTGTTSSRAGATWNGRQPQRAAPSTMRRAPHTDSDHHTNSRPDTGSDEDACLDAAPHASSASAQRGPRERLASPPSPVTTNDNPSLCSAHSHVSSSRSAERRASSLAGFELLRHAASHAPNGKAATTSRPAPAPNRVAQSPASSSASRSDENEARALSASQHWREVQPGSPKGSYCTEPARTGMARPAHGHASRASTTPPPCSDDAHGLGEPQPQPHSAAAAAANGVGRDLFHRTNASSAGHEPHDDPRAASSASRSASELSVWTSEPQPRATTPTKEEMPAHGQNVAETKQATALAALWEAVRALQQQQQQQQYHPDQNAAPAIHRARHASTPMATETSTGDGDSADTQRSEGAAPSLLPTTWPDPEAATHAGEHQCWYPNGGDEDQLAGAAAGAAVDDEEDAAAISPSHTPRYRTYLTPRGTHVVQEPVPHTPEVAAESTDTRALARTDTIHDHGTLIAIDDYRLPQRARPPHFEYACYIAPPFTSQLARNDSMRGVDEEDAGDDEEKVAVRTIPEVEAHDRTLALGDARAPTGRVASATMRETRPIKERHCPPSQPDTPSSSHTKPSPPARPRPSSVDEACVAPTRQDHNTAPAAERLDGSPTEATLPAGTAWLDPSQAQTPVSLSGASSVVRQVVAVASPVNDQSAKKTGSPLQKPTIAVVSHSCRPQQLPPPPSPRTPHSTPSAAPQDESATHATADVIGVRASDSCSAQSWPASSPAVGPTQPTPALPSSLAESTASWQALHSQSEEDPTEQGAARGPGGQPQRHGEGEKSARGRGGGDGIASDVFSTSAGSSVSPASASLAPVSSGLQESARQQPITAQSPSHALTQRVSPRTGLVSHAPRRPSPLMEAHVGGAPAEGRASAHIDTTPPVLVRELAEPNSLRPSSHDVEKEDYRLSTGTAHYTNNNSACRTGRDEDLQEAAIDASATTTDDDDASEVSSISEGMAHGCAPQARPHQSPREDENSTENDSVSAISSLPRDGQEKPVASVATSLSPGTDMTPLERYVYPDVPSIPQEEEADAAQHDADTSGDAESERCGSSCVDGEGIESASCAPTCTSSVPERPRSSAPVAELHPREPSESLTSTPVDAAPSPVKPSRLRTASPNTSLCTHASSSSAPSSMLSKVLPSSDSSSKGPMEEVAAEPRTRGEGGSRQGLAPEDQCEDEAADEPQYEECRPSWRRYTGPPPPTAGPAKHSPPSARTNNEVIGQPVLRRYWNYLQQQQPQSASVEGQDEGIGRRTVAHIAPSYTHPTAPMSPLSDTATATTMDSIDAYVRGIDHYCRAFSDRTVTTLFEDEESDAAEGGYFGGGAYEDVEL